MNQDLEEVEESSKWIFGGKICLAQDSLEQRIQGGEHILHVREAARGPVWFERRE